MGVWNYYFVVQSLVYLQIRILFFFIGGRAEWRRMQSVRAFDDDDNDVLVGKSMVLCGFTFGSEEQLSGVH